MSAIILRRKDMVEFDFNLNDLSSFDDIPPLSLIENLVNKLRKSLQEKNTKQAEMIIKYMGDKNLIPDRDSLESILSLIKSLGINDNNIYRSVVGLIGKSVNHQHSGL